ncbi:DHHA1 domain-containing protein [Streptomyces sp. NPDC005962]|uniref:DHHA1 domain-containing protein n=1 Tax=Streptomyces sp. NPDC005962 TaxID=3154466 RepID=UPI0033FE4941
MAQARAELVSPDVTGVAPDELRSLAADALARLGRGPAIVVLGAEHEGKALLTAAISSDLHQGGTEAGQILTEAARVVGGGSGSRGSLVSAGGCRPEAFNNALDLAAQDSTRLLSNR